MLRGIYRWRHVSGNFICDIMLAATDADLAILNSGTLRSDRVHPRGEFRMKDLTSILPMLDPCVVLEASGMWTFQSVTVELGYMWNSVKTDNRIYRIFSRIAKIRYIRVLRYHYHHIAIRSSSVHVSLFNDLGISRSELTSQFPVFYPCLDEDLSIYYIYIYQSLFLHWKCPI